MAVKASGQGCLYEGEGLEKGRQTVSFAASMKQRSVPVEIVMQHDCKTR